MDNCSLVETTRSFLEPCVIFSPGLSWRWAEACRTLQTLLLAVRLNLRPRIFSLSCPKIAVRYFAKFLAHRRSHQHQILVNQIHYHHAGTNVDFRGDMNLILVKRIIHFPANHLTCRYPD